MKIVINCLICSELNSYFPDYCQYPSASTQDLQGLVSVAHRNEPHNLTEMRPGNLCASVITK